MELLIGFLVGGGINLAVVGSTMVYLRSAFLSEKNFHVQLTARHPRVLAGPRRTPLKISDAEAQFQAVKTLSRQGAWSWPLTFWKLYGPRKNSSGQHGIERIREKAISSQRSTLLVNAMKNGYEHDAVVPLIMEANSDEVFELLGKAIATPRGEKPLELTEISKKIKSQEPSMEIVLMGPRTPEIFPISPQAISRIATTTKLASDELAGNIGKKGLPEGYSWGQAWENKGGEFERMIIFVSGAGGKRIKEESFSTSVYSTPDQQASRIQAIQRGLILSAQHHSSPDGLAPQVRALLT